MVVGEHTSVGTEMKLEKVFPSSSHIIDANTLERSASHETKVFFVNRVGDDAHLRPFGRRSSCGQGMMRHEDRKQVC